jgi:hypothetical protein
MNFHNQLPIPLRNTIWELGNRLMGWYKIRQWEREGAPIPPPHQVKQRTIANVQRQTGYSTLVETGTFRGDMIAAQLPRFKKLYSIELSKTLYEEACNRFKGKKKVKLVCGDSGQKLSEIVQTLEQPAIFWLDGHYSYGRTAKGKTNCPIFEELEAIYKNALCPHCILIDDARLFNGTDEYPGIDELRQWFAERGQPQISEIMFDTIICQITLPNK